ncbi:hypothetical protein I551_4111 [Mycobacterium ulcerans str. Harvey]|uniref:Uncharacterized protein n=1 Tax=Mycobacterium ulcerans str. Harvey TaxID=1299332 RepID=A0ABN0QXF4_MYCUL|nr:hypothetical protein I551_4111 [Mycobacterium ulcerans str. Harvey]
MGEMGADLPGGQPRAYSDNTTSSTSVNLRWRFSTIFGSNVPARSRGHRSQWNRTHQ